jgi:hypothetical protein
MVIPHGPEATVIKILIMDACFMLMSVYGQETVAARRRCGAKRQRNCGDERSPKTENDLGQAELENLGHAF